METFSTGATRDDSSDKLDFEGFLCPLALERYAKYMHKHRLQEDGELRASDNWQKGIPQSRYASSMFRHFVDWWHLHRGYNRKEVRFGERVPLSKEDALCGVIFNAFGYLREELMKERRSIKEAAGETA